MMMKPPCHDDVLKHPPRTSIDTVTPCPLSQWLSRYNAIKEYVWHELKYKCIQIWNAEQQTAPISQYRVVYYTGMLSW
jgi:hypothetical protein